MSRTIGVDEFKQAAWLNDFGTVRAYVNQGGDVNAIATNGVSALVSFNLDILNYLYDHGADLNKPWADGNPPICFHAWEVNEETVRWFLAKGVNPNVSHLMTAENCLHNLTAKPTLPDKRHDIVEFLLQQGALPNAKTAMGVETGNFMRDVRVVGETPLHRAAAYQSKATIRLLLDYGADKTILDGHNESPLSWASRHWRDREILRMLCYGPYRVG